MNAVGELRVADDVPCVVKEGLKVLHIVPAMFGKDGLIGGAERYAFELARHMAARVPTTLLSFGPDEREFFHGPLRVRVLGKPWHVRGQSQNPLSLRILPEIRRAEVVHCHQQHVVVTSLSALAGRLLRKPVFVTDLGGGGWDISGYTSTDRWFTGHLHISEFSRTVMRQTGQSSARVIMGGVDTEKFSPDPSVPRERRAVFVGRLLPHKGLADLVEGIPRDIPLDIIGQPYDSAFFERLKQRAIGKQIAFRHDCDDAGLVDAYRRASCVVLPSVYEAEGMVPTSVPELLGQTLLEGMACGAPGVCTDVASLPEVVEHGVTGFIVPPNNPAALGARIQWLVDRPDQVAAMGRAGRDRVIRHFTWKAVVDRCLRAYSA